MKYPGHLWNESQANTIRPICVRPDQAAAMLGISRSTLDRLTCSGELTFVKLRRPKMYAVADLEALVQANRLASNRDPNASSLAGVGDEVRIWLRCNRGLTHHFTSGQN